MCKVGRASGTFSEAGAATLPTAPPLIKVALLGDSQVRLEMEACRAWLMVLEHAGVCGYG
jgi:hypothetical protein